MRAIDMIGFHDDDTKLGSARERVILGFHDDDIELRCERESVILFGVVFAILFLLAFI
jgi:hypothetical protein